MKATITYSYHLSRFLVDLSGNAKKVIVLDADNTLWGGVAGEVGTSNIEVGVESGRDLAFYQFQLYIKSLEEDGVLICLATKNNVSTIDDVFSSNPHMPLKKEDFSVIKASWQNKELSILEIAKELNISLASIVFIDDSSYEIERVSSLLPEVDCLLLSATPYEYISRVRNRLFFSSESKTTEDRTKTQMIHESKARSELIINIESLEKFDSDLKTVIKIKEFSNESERRIIQLANKTNQFNLNKEIFSSSLYKKLIGDNTRKSFYAQLSDSIGDLGLIGAISGKVINGTLVIDHFFMSCRAFNREVEYKLYTHLTNKMTYEKIRFDSKETGRNKLVFEFIDGVIKNG